MRVPAVSSFFGGPSRLTERLRRIRGRPSVAIRRALAAGLLLTAVVLAVRPAAAAGDSGGPVVVSAHDLASGSVLHPPDLRVVRMPDDVRPAGTVASPGSLDGRISAGPVRAGEPITDARLVEPSPGIPTTGDPRTSVVPVRLADAGVAALLHAGSKVDVIGGANGEDHQVLALAAVVVSVTSPEPAARNGPGDRTPGPLVLLRLPSDVATRVAGASLVKPVAVTLR